MLTLQPLLFWNKQSTLMEYWSEARTMSTKNRADMQKVMLIPQLPLHKLVGGEGGGEENLLHNLL